MPRIGKRPEDRKRRVNSTGEPRTRRVKIVLSEAEYERVKDAAQAQGVSVQRFYEECVNRDSTQDGVRASALLHRTGRFGEFFPGDALTMINDIARHANATGQVREDLEKAFTQLDETFRVLDDGLAFVREELIALSPSKDAL